MIDFTHRSYLELLEYIKGLGYPIGPFRDFPKSGPYVILRHDIDFSVLKAKEMAALDYQIGVTSTFCVLLTSPYYNALSENNIQSIKEIAEMGHEIGLHYDSTALEGLKPNDLYRRIATLANCLENNLGVKIIVISQHKPTQSNIKQEFPGFVDAYSGPFFKYIAYLSDSGMIFRVDDIYAFFRNNPRSQLLVHPIWWHPERKTREEVFEYIKEHLSIQINNVIYSEKRSIQQFLERQNRASRA